MAVQALAHRLLGGEVRLVHKEEIRNVSSLVPLPLSVAFQRVGYGPSNFVPDFSGFLSRHVHHRDDTGNFLVIRDYKPLSNIRGEIHEGFLPGVN